MVLFCIVSGVSRDFLGIPFSAGNFRAGAQNGIIVNVEGTIFSYKHVWMAWVGLITIENVVIMYLSIVLDIVLGDSSFKIT